MKENLISYKEVGKEQPKEAPETIDAQKVQENMRKQEEDYAKKLQSLFAQPKMNRAQRRKQEREAIKRLKAGKPIIKRDYRWQKLSEEDRKKRVEAFEKRCKACFENMQGEFRFTFEWCPEFQAVCEKYGATLAQASQYVWACRIPLPDQDTAFKLRMNQVAFGKSAVCIFLSKEDAQLEERIKADDRIVKYRKIDGEGYNFICLLKGKTSKVYDLFDSHTDDQILLADAIEGREPKFNCNDNEGIEEIIAMYEDILEHVEVTAKWTGTIVNYIVELTYVKGEEAKTEEITAEQHEKQIEELTAAGLYRPVEPAGMYKVEEPEQAAE